MAHKKGQGSTKNGRDSNPQYRGVKVWGGQVVQAGQRIGLIRFGSRVDVYLPDGQTSFVAVGQRSIAGETVLADLRANEGARLCRRS